MEHLESLVGILTAVALGAISPGPSFVFVARTAVVESRRHGVAACLGMATGAFLLTAAALLGLQGVLLAFPLFYRGLRIAGGLYLVYMGVHIWQAARKPVYVDSDLPHAVKVSPKHIYQQALITQLSNPATSITLASIFAAFLPRDINFTFQAMVACFVLLIDLSWYSIVALVLSADAPRTLYLRHQAAIDRVIGVIIIGMAGKLISAAFS